MIDLETEAEKRAQKAEELPAFSSIKLRHIKQQLGTLLGLVRRAGRTLLHSYGTIQKNRKIKEMNGS